MLLYSSKNGKKYSHKNIRISITVFSVMIIRNVSWAPNQNIRLYDFWKIMLHYWTSGYLEFSFSSTGINDILKYFNIENILNYNNITVFTLILNK